MPSKSTAWKVALAKLVFQNVAAEDIGDGAGLLPSAAAGSLYVALHTSDPGVGGTQSTNEVSYTGYARVAIARSALGFSVSAGGEISNVAAIAFPECAGGAAVATHFSIGVAGSGAETILYRDDLDPSIDISIGVTPTIDAGALTGEEE